ncbi:Hypothetical protein R9X50_00303800 [Acrodontium crateriforme]|uniref:Centrosomin N-terminal motif 1 domain-containing protein n=1 Tax=Acrodontium crateriforme TaxID=150365 RepID=A0AAQ3M3M3_9PEZI|nr:Hypothetical protein R9X50_00303800 [Acrodontium crateriforme]
MASGLGPRQPSSHHSQESFPASQYLQERLQERRARNTRPARFRQSDFGPRRGLDDDIFLTVAEEGERKPHPLHSSPFMPASKRPVDVGEGGRRRTLGARDLDEQMDRLTKENFALKLELDHRRDHTAKLRLRIDDMQEQVERAQNLEDEHKELLLINTQLVEALEQRDKAIEEAMDIICELEDKISDMEERASNTRPSTANADSGYAGTETLEQAPVATPPSANSVGATKPSRIARPPPAAASAASNKLLVAVNSPQPVRARREPSILTERQTSTNALRNVFLASAKDLQSVKSFTSLVSRRDGREDDGNDILNSPRLSVLSESSFPSMYSPKKISPERFTWESPDVGEATHGGLNSRQYSMNRVSQWIDEGEEAVDETPSKASRPCVSTSDTSVRGLSPTPTPRLAEDIPFQSLNNALSSAAAEQSGTKLQAAVSYIVPHQTLPDGSNAKQARTSSVSGPAFGSPLLPPTPDSATTQMLRTSYSSIIGEKSRSDNAPTPPIHEYAFHSSIPISPKQMRSSIELNTAYISNLKYRDEYYSSYGHNGLSGTSYDVDVKSANREAFNDDHTALATPNRLLRRSKTAAVGKNHDENEVSTPQTIRQVPRRRQSSSETFVSPRKPDLNRADTSPNFLGNIGRIVSNGSRSGSEPFASPRSSNSGLVINKTAPLPELRNGSLSPDGLNGRTRTRTSASPARRLSHRTQMLFRRMSNSQTEPRQFEPRSPREKSPLPTLTSTPSSQYHQIPKELRRPSTAESPRQPDATPTTTAHVPRQPSTHTHTRISSFSGRTRPERPSSVILTERERANSILEKAKRSPFPFRRSSINQSNGEALAGITQSATPSNELEETAKASPTRRRGSFRDAVAATARRPFIRQ